MWSCVSPFPGKLMLYQKTDANAGIHPNADVLFRSAAATSCPVVAVVMTGMGSDGMLGAKDLVARKNAHVMAQDPDSCIVDGMPSSTINAGLASAVLTPAKRLARGCPVCASTARFPLSKPLSDRERP
jgi:two-component system, chemotaxis family, protein-glutamate methylesterase/glutaminase